MPSLRIRKSVGISRSLTTREMNGNFWIKYTIITMIRIPPRGILIDNDNQSLMKSFLVSKRSNRILNITPTTGYLRNGILHAHPGGWDDIAFHIYIFSFKMLEGLPLLDASANSHWVDRHSAGGLASVPFNSVEHVLHAWKTNPRWKSRGNL
ncbi:hypothetical protein TEQG_02129 [Trichophyton equinum CBS 127.97]|uniref:Uncharacterized protein n=1 Tax=Trichophyton equinum (strain ATCC MYA-4606 / CBS 127.97) TaxID=559882 RepID=F2PMJ5_TRIEC|nr:hypothetical protein TEQG_02129 [Trichophyton equinum CBS 127.97]